MKMRLTGTQRGPVSSLPPARSVAAGATKKHDERFARRGAKDGARRGGTTVDAEEPVQFRLPRGRAIGGDEPRRPVIIGGDSSSFGPRLTKPAKRAKPERPSQVSRPPKIGAGVHPLDATEEDIDETGAAPADGAAKVRPAKGRWSGPGGRKAGSRPSGVGRPTGVGRRKAAGRGKVAGRAKASGRAKHAAPPKKAGRVKRRGAGRGEPA